MRANLTNDDWRGSNDFSPERIDKTNENYELTLGGRFVRDRLWYFGSGRTEELEQNNTGRVLNLPYVRGTEEDRYSVKLTGSITASHQLQATYNETEDVQTNVPPRMQLVRACEVPLLAPLDGIERRGGRRRRPCR